MNIHDADKVAVLCLVSGNLLGFGIGRQQYALWTLGPALVILWLADHYKQRLIQ